MISVSVGFVDEELAVFGVEEEERIFVALFHDPATTVFRVDLNLAVFAADALFGQEFVLAVVDLQVGVAVGVVDQGIHVVAAEGEGDEVEIVGVADVFSHYNDVGDMVVIPVAVAVDPEARPVVGARDEGVPVEAVAVDHAVMMGMPEIGGRMDGAVRGGHGAGMAWTGISACRGRGDAAGTPVGARHTAAFARATALHCGATAGGCGTAAGLDGDTACAAAHGAAGADGAALSATRGGVVTAGTAAGETAARGFAAAGSREAARGTAAGEAAARGARRAAARETAAVAGGAGIAAAAG